MYIYRSISIVSFKPAKIRESSAFYGCSHIYAGANKNTNRNQHWLISLPLTCTSLINNVHPPPNNATWCIAMHACCVYIPTHATLHRLDNNSAHDGHFRLFAGRSAVLSIINTGVYIFVGNGNVWSILSWKIMTAVIAFMQIWIKNSDLILLVRAKNCPLLLWTINI